MSSRGQLTLAWTWPDKTLVVYELTSRQDPQPTTRAPGQGGAVISECPGQPGRPYCKKLSLLRAQAKDTGYYSCYYKDVKAARGTTAVNVYVFVRGESLSNNSPTHKMNQMCLWPREGDRTLNLKHLKVVLTDTENTYAKVIKKTLKQLRVSATIGFDDTFAAEK